MKKLLLIAIITSSFTFASKMRFTMEKDRKVKNTYENVNVDSRENRKGDDTPAPLTDYETGDAGVSPTNEKINTDISRIVIVIKYIIPTRLSALYSAINCLSYSIRSCEIISLSLESINVL